MLILPLHRRIGWKNLPIVTLLIVAANTLIFLSTQLDDSEEMEKAFDYYQESGLYKIERPGFLAYLDEISDLDYLTGKYETENSAADAMTQLFGIQSGREFQRRLHAGEVIKTSDEIYPEWKEKRDYFESLYESVTYVHFGLRAGQPEFVSLFSHMFLHAGFGHLIGNMLFLFALGVLIEDLMGRGLFLAFYLLVGLGSAGFYILFSSDSLLPGIGASGAIAGLMGMYTVIYGFRRIRFFYSIGIYFDYVSLPAIVLLPLWIGNELFQLWFYTESNINYLAHLGGLISGATLAMLMNYSIAPFDLSHLEAEEQDRKSERNLADARLLYQNMEYQKALLILRRLIHEGCREREAIYLYYQCSRIAPESSDYHKSAKALLNIPERDRATAELIRETYHEYLKLAHPGPKLNSETICRLADCFIGQRWCAEADKLMSIVSKKGLSCPDAFNLSDRYTEVCRRELARKRV
jgi:membrane associated rhomboid family serine protease